MGCEALREAGRAADAVPRAREAVETLKRLYPGSEHLTLANALDNLARNEAAAGAYAEALAHHDEGIAMYRKLQAKGAPGAATAQAFRARTLLAMGRASEAEAELRAAVEELTPSQQSSPSQYWEPFGLLAFVACHDHAADCGALREKARAAVELPLAATAQAQLRKALEEER
jgi:tetratricopeptide (TPR) repeat protein